jgi:hypothetical protein
MNVKNIEQFAEQLAAVLITQNLEEYQSFCLTREENDAISR